MILKSGMKTKFLKEKLLSHLNHVGKPLAYRKNNSCMIFFEFPVGIFFPWELLYSGHYNIQ